MVGTWKGIGIYMGVPLVYQNWAIKLFRYQII